MTAGRWTSAQLLEKYLARIREVDPKIHSVIELNPDAPAIAAALDRERKDKGVRGPLHGIPVLIKDNIDTGDKMMTSAGSLALASSRRQGRGAGGEACARRARSSPAKRI